MKTQIDQINSPIFLPDEKNHLTTLFGRCFILIWLSIFGFFHEAIGQNPGLINYSLKEGLPSTEIYNLFQDSHGFIWFASDHGIAKFDGYEMKVLDLWYYAVDAEMLLAEVKDAGMRRGALKRLAKARESSTSEGLFPKLADTSGGSPVFKDSAPADSAASKVTPYTPSTGAKPASGLTGACE